jgi:hypothetical protein
MCKRTHCTNPRPVSCRDDGALHTGAVPDCAARLRRRNRAHHTILREQSTVTGPSTFSSAANCPPLPTPSEMLLSMAFCSLKVTAHSLQRDSRFGGRRCSSSSLKALLGRDASAQCCWCILCKMHYIFSACVTVPYTGLRMRFELGCWLPLGDPAAMNTRGETFFYQTGKKCDRASCGSDHNVGRTVNMT